ncbi:hypothetical protein TSOC_007059 [Tetrabaena socialis]|uniref:Uncharacterized protein n=1 Tax=Tetrabaena socialis TaxID=47790 RepID=A0A2J8A1Z8_9CHLO|nr:hypothetical protein TSOC_007059 [Tetrabaena socialis]|eukprot:PNH06549.1 hypothetical protein TSOC_007059 [Tetrabaena socialis]
MLYEARYTSAEQPPPLALRWKPTASTWRRSSRRSLLAAERPPPPALGLRRSAWRSGRRAPLAPCAGLYSGLLAGHGFGLLAPGAVLDSGGGSAAAGAPAGPPSAGPGAGLWCGGASGMGPEEEEEEEEEEADATEAEGVLPTASGMKHSLDLLHRPPAAAMSVPPWVSPHPLQPVPWELRLGSAKPHALFRGLLPEEQQLDSATGHRMVLTAVRNVSAANNGGSPDPAVKGRLNYMAGRRRGWCAEAAALKQAVSTCPVHALAFSAACRALKGVSTDPEAKVEVMCVKAHAAGTWQAAHHHGGNRENPALLANPQFRLLAIVRISVAPHSHYTLSLGSTHICTVAQPSWTISVHDAVAQGEVMPADIGSTRFARRATVLHATEPAADLQLSILFRLDSNKNSSNWQDKVAANVAGMVPGFRVELEEALSRCGPIADLDSELGGGLLSSMSYKRCYTRCSMLKSRTEEMAAVLRIAGSVQLFNSRQASMPGVLTAMQDFYEAFRLGLYLRPFAIAADAALTEAKQQISFADRVTAGRSPQAPLGAGGASVVIRTSPGDAELEATLRLLERHGPSKFAHHGTATGADHAAVIRRLQDDPVTCQLRGEYAEAVELSGGDNLRILQRLADRLASHFSGKGSPGCTPETVALGRLGIVQRGIDGGEAAQAARQRATGSKGPLCRSLVELQALAADTGVDVADVAAADRMLMGIDGGATTYEPGEPKPDGTVSRGTREGKSAGGSAKGGLKGQGPRKAPSNFPLALGFATWHHEACSSHHASCVTADKRGTGTFAIKCPLTTGGCGKNPRMGDISDVTEYPTLKMAQDALERDRSACSKCAAAKAKAAAGPS